MSFASAYASTLLLLAALLAAGCADTKTFVNGDGRGADARLEGGLPPWPDIGLLPDGQPPPASQAMYAHSKDTLFTIDPVTLKLAPVAKFNLAAGTPPDMNDIAVTPTGVLYGVSINDLHRIDHKTARLTQITKLQGTANVALTFEVAGTLLAADKEGTLRRIDPKTGQVTDLGKYGAGMSASGDMVAIKDGTLFGVNDGGTAFDDNQLITINPATGAAKAVGAIGFHHVWGLAFWKGKVYGLTKAGDLLAIDPKTGKGTLVQNYPYEFWGAAVTPLAPID